MENHYINKLIPRGKNLNYIKVDTVYNGRLYKSNYKTLAEEDTVSTDLNYDITITVKTIHDRGSRNATSVKFIYDKPVSFDIYYKTIHVSEQSNEEIVANTTWELAVPEYTTETETLIDCNKHSMFTTMNMTFLKFSFNGIEYDGGHYNTNTNTPICLHVTDKEVTRISIDK